MGASSIALSGIHAASLRLDTAAHNVANIETPDFRRQQTLQRTLEPAGDFAVGEHPNAMAISADSAPARYSYQSPGRATQSSVQAICHCIW